MIETQVFVDATRPEMSDDNEDIHAVCCWHHRVTLCGFHLGESAEDIDADQDAECVVCYAEEDSDYCPVYGACRETDILDD